MPNAFLTLDTTTGDPFTVGDTHIRLTTQTLRIRFPFTSSGGITWTRPVSIRAQFSDAEEITTPIVDVTRFAQIAILACGFAGGLILLAMLRRRQDAHSVLDGGAGKE